MTDKVKACLSYDTEVLTDVGFKLFSELSQTDKLAQFDPHDNNAITFATSTDTRSGQFKGDMSRIHKKGRSLDILCTPDLGIVQKYDNPYTNQRRIQVIPAGNLKKGTSYYVPMAGHGSASGASLTNKQRFLIATQADGHISDRYSGVFVHTKPVKFTLTKQRKIVRIEALLARLGYEYAKRSIEKRAGYFDFSVSTPVADNPTKNFREWIPRFADISSDWASEFILEAVEWDGHWNRNADGSFRGSIHYSSVVKENADTLAIIASLCGWRPLITHTPDNRSEKFSDIYRVHLLPNHEWVRTGTLLRSKQEYNGMVYGATTPKGTMIVRRNGAIAFIGCNAVEA